jgi:uncharacterized phage-associated protein
MENVRSRGEVRGMALATANDVANIFLSWANDDGDLITNLKLQKLIYYAQAWHLVHFDKPLFNDVIEAWEFGPVIPDTYHQFKKFGYSAIKYKKTGDEKKVFTKNQLSYLIDVYDTFIKYSAHELVNMTHNEKPWRKAYNSADKTISLKLMKEYYSKLLT